jgi:hypothetical protein
MYRAALHIISNENTKRKEPSARNIISSERCGDSKMQQALADLSNVD